MDDRHGDRGPQPPEFDLSTLDLSQFDAARFARAARLGFLGMAVVGLLVLLDWAISFRVDWLWFQGLGHADVLLTIVIVKVGLFLVGALLFAALGGSSLVAALRTAQADSDMARRGMGWLATAGVALGAAVMGGALAGSWEAILLWWHRVPFDATDPVFGLDLGFHVFTLPFLQLARVWLLVSVALVLMGTAAVYWLQARLPGMRPADSRGLHLASLGAALALLMAAGHWLDRYLTLHSSDGAVHGVGYTELHATIPAHTTLAFVAVLAGVLLVVGAMRRRPLWMLAAPAIWLVAAFLGLGLYPGFVQRFQVEPSELARERPFLEDHIEMTRRAYGLDRIGSRSHPARGEVDAATVAANQGTVQNVRLWDEGPLRESYNQIQFFRLYYDFVRVFTDRYEIDGELRQIMLSTRELSPDRLPEEAQRWVNRHLQFTHGYGVAASPVTEVAADGRPAFVLKDLPPTGQIPLDRPEVYYGLASLDYVVANTRMEEFNYPGSDGPVYSHYGGEGGVEMGGWLRRILYAWHFGDINLLISDEIGPESRIQYHRTVQERVGRVAPFLRLDGSPYVVVADGRLSWIQDAYTVSDSYPYSLPWQGRFNYIRNSVKVVVDAYDGEVGLYLADPDDPVVRTYGSIFPGLFQPLDEMPASLRAHIRYPRDIFTIQVQMLLQYHMQDPTVFYNKEDQWSLPQETSFERSRVLEPYYIVARLPGAETEEFLLIQPFTPANRHNLVAWIAARNDPEHYGELSLFRFPSGRHVDGPNQVEARIDNDAVISEQFTLWGQVGSEVSRGNLLVIPLGEAILYAEPIFLRPETLDFPELRRIILADSRSVVMHPTLDRSVAALVGDLPAVATPAETAATPIAGEATAGAGAAAPAPGMSQEQIDALVRSLEETIGQLQGILEELRGQREGGGGQ